MNTETASGPRRLLTLPPALRYPKYRVYWLGTLASVGGFQMAIFTQGWVTYELTGSALYLGYVGLSNASAAIALNLVGGVFADKLDKRKLIFFTQIIITSLIFLLGFLTLTDTIRVWHIIAIGFVAGGVNAFDQPARQALYPHLIDRKVMTSAVALNSAIWSGVRIIAPVGAGLVISLIGTPASFFLAGSGFLLMGIVIALLKVPRIESASSGSPAHDLVEGLKFIGGSTVFSFLIGMTFFNSFFGMAYMTMMPAFAVDILKVGADGQGVLMSAGGIGALAVTLYLGSVGDFSRKGLLIIGGGVMFGISIAAFALTSRYVGSFELAMALMVDHGSFQLDVHDFHHELAATACSEQHARSGDGFLRDDLEYHAARRRAGRGHSDLRRCADSGRDRRRTGGRVRARPGDDKPPGPQHRLDSARG